MSRIIQHRKLIEGGIVRERQFDWAGSSEGHGYAFACDEKGEAYLDQLTECAQKNYAKCLANSFTDEHGNHDPIVDRGIRQWRARDYYEPAILKCDCGETVQLTGFTNTCDCGFDYNMSGQQLADRSQWGSETNESVSDILSADSDYDSYDYNCE